MRSTFPLVNGFGIGAEISDIGALEGKMMGCSIPDLSAKIHNRRKAIVLQGVVCLVLIASLSKPDVCNYWLPMHLRIVVQNPCQK